MAQASWKARKTGVSRQDSQKNSKKPGFFAVFRFTSLCPSLMIEIDSGGNCRRGL
jgi:hypothetical protein